jgi:transcriptional regulator with PAS, ATPase and Fis domain
VDIRVIAATNRSLASLVERRLFRADLFYRLSGVDIRIPSLRERQGDVLILAEHFLETHRTIRRLRLSAAAMDALFTYDWPGNVRELERIIERAVALAETDTIELEDLPATVRGEYSEVILPSLRRNDTLRMWAGRYARLVFERCHRNKRETCRALDISYHTLRAYLRLPAHGGPEDAAQEIAPDRVGASTGSAEGIQMDV